MNVCLAARDGRDGIATFTQTLALGLRELGHRVTVLRQAEGAQPDGPLGGTGHGDGVRSLAIRPSDVWWVRGGRFHPHHVRVLRGALQWSRAVAQAVRRLAAAGEADVLVAPELLGEAFYAVRGRTVPVVVVCHSPFDLVATENRYSSRPVKAAIRTLERATLRRADRVVAPSRHLAERLVRAGLTRRPDVIASPLDETLFTPTGATAAAAAPVVLCVGRVERLKGGPVLAEALVELGRRGLRPRCVFVGRDADVERGQSTRAAIQAIAASGGVADRVEFLGQVDRATLVEHYRAADVCVTPSSWENYPYAVLEALACGRAVVATRVGGIPEIVEDGVTGRLFAPGAAAELADILADLLARPDERRRLGDNGRRFVESRCARGVVADRYSDLLSGVVGRRSA